MQSFSTNKTRNQEVLCNNEGQTSKSQFSWSMNKHYTSTLLNANSKFLSQPLGKKQYESLKCNIDVDGLTCQYCQTKYLFHP